MHVIHPVTMYSALEEYYRILGVTDAAGLSEIKRAFRVRAKELHPDLNKNPNAHQQFILLNEAYEYLVNLKTGKIFENNSTSTKKYKTYERWQDNEAERARHRAEYYANKKYSDFTESAQYKKMTSVNAAIGRIALVFVIFVLVVIPIVLTITKGSTGFWGSLVLILGTLPFTIDIIRKEKKF